MSQSLRKYYVVSSAVKLFFLTLKVFGNEINSTKDWHDETRGVRWQHSSEKFSVSKVHHTVKEIKGSEKGEKERQRGGTAEILFFLPRRNMSRCEMAVKHLGCAGTVMYQGGTKGEIDDKLRKGVVVTIRSERQVWAPFVRWTNWRTYNFMQKFYTLCIASGKKWHPKTISIKEWRGSIFTHPWRKAREEEHHLFVYLPRIF